MSNQANILHAAADESRARLESLAAVSFEELTPEDVHLAASQLAELLEHLAAIASLLQASYAVSLNAGPYDEERFLDPTHPASAGVALECAAVGLRVVSVGLFAAVPSISAEWPPVDP
jgi:hypothetical protein